MRLTVSSWSWLLNCKSRTRNALHYARVRIHINCLNLKGVVGWTAAISDRRVSRNQATVTGFMGCDGDLIIRTGRCEGCSKQQESEQHLIHDRSQFVRPLPPEVFLPVICWQDARDLFEGEIGQSFVTVAFR